MLISIFDIQNWHYCLYVDTFGKFLLERWDSYSGDFFGTEHLSAERVLDLAKWLKMTGRDDDLIGALQSDDANALFNLACSIE